MQRLQVAGQGDAGLVQGLLQGEEADEQLGQHPHVHGEVCLGALRQLFHGDGAPLLGDLEHPVVPRQKLVLHRHGVGAALSRRLGLKGLLHVNDPGHGLVYPGGGGVVALLQQRGQGHALG